jgi:hypothetical protein
MTPEPSVSPLAGLNRETAEIVKAYLDYCARIVSAAVDSKGYHNEKFKDINDELILTPDELVQLIDRVQVALSKV